MNLLLLLLLAACGPTTDDTSGTVPTTLDGSARISNDCLPTDGAGISLLVGLPDATCDAVASGENLLLTVPGVFPPTDGETYTFAEVNSGYGQYTDATGAQVQLVGGTLTITSATADAFTGTYTAEAADGRSFAGSFTAASCDTKMVCG